MQQHQQQTSSTALSLKARRRFSKTTAADENPIEALEIEKRQQTTTPNALEIPAPLEEMMATENSLKSLDEARAGPGENGAKRSADTERGPECLRSVLRSPSSGAMAQSPRLRTSPSGGHLRFLAVHDDEDDEDEDGGNARSGKDGLTPTMKSAMCQTNGSLQGKRRHASKHNHHQNRRTSMANLRRHRSTLRRQPGGGSNGRRWSSRRRLSYARRGSRFTSDDLDEMALQQCEGSGEGPSIAGCVHALPLRPHGLCVAALAAILSMSGLLVSATLLLRNAVLTEFAALPPGCNNYHYQQSSDSIANNSAAPEAFDDDDLSSSGEDFHVECSTYATFIYLIGYGLQGSENKSTDLEADLGPSSKFYFLSSSLLWCCLCISGVFLWVSLSLWQGIWYCRRRKLVPWLLVTGVTILFLIMTSVWFVICNSGWKKLFGLIPAVVGLLFLYWWLLINDLLEEIHEDKKADIAASMLLLSTADEEDEEDLEDGVITVERNGVNRQRSLTLV